MVEEWRDVLGYEGQYLVSNLGRVKSMVAKHPGLILRPQVSSRGYLMVQLKVNQKPDTRLVHTLVDQAFNGPRQPGLEVNHKDGVKANNALSNLERVTRSQNMKHAIATGLKVQLRGERHGRARLSEQQVREIRAAVQPGERTPYGLLTSFAKKFGVARSTIYSAVHKNWSHLE